MKQVVQYLKNGRIEVIEVPRPAVQPGRVLVRTAYSVISAGTERARVELGKRSLLGKALARPAETRKVLAAVRSQGAVATIRKVTDRLEAPSPLGYSCSGVVVEVGEGVVGLQPGDLVACAGAGFANHAELNLVPRNLCARVPEAARGGAGVPISGATEADTGMTSRAPVAPVDSGASSSPESSSLQEAAFATLGAIALHGVRRAEVAVGETCVVLGLGLIGQLAAQILKASGCVVVGMDLDASRCALAAELGCDATAESGAELAAVVASLTGSAGADAVVIAAATRSDEPVALAGEIARDRGVVVVVGDVGLTVPREPFYRKELDLRLSRSYGPGRYDAAYEEKGGDYPIGYVRWTEGRNLEGFLRLLQSGGVRVLPLVTHRFAIGDAARAYGLIDGDEPHLGVLLEYGEAPDLAAGAGDAATGAGKAYLRGPSGATAVMGSRPVVVAAGSRAEDALTGARAGVSASGNRPAPAEAAETTPGTLGIGVIGAGTFARDVLIPGLRGQPGVALRGVVSASGLSAADAARKFGFAYSGSDPRRVLDDPSIEAVVIATRHDSHAALAIEALEAGKKVFLEKPLALDAAELAAVRECFDRLESEGAEPFLQVGFNRRFAPATAELMAFLGAAARPVHVLCRVNAGAVPPGHWTSDPQVGGGRIVGEACHFIDLLLYIVGRRAREVHAQALPSTRPENADNVAVTVRFEDGSIGALHYLTNGDSAAGKERIEASGGGAMAIIDDFRRLSLVRGGKVRRQGGRWRAADKGHAGELRAFVEAVRSGAASPVPFAEALLSTVATLAIGESLRRGAPATLSVD